MKYDGIECAITNGMVVVNENGKAYIDELPDFFHIRYKGVNVNRQAVLIEDVEDFEERIFKYVNKCLKYAGLI